MHDPNDLYRLEWETGRLFWINPPKNHAEKVGREAGQICRGKGKNKDYWQVRFAGKAHKRARIVFYMVHGRWPEPCVDHRNGDSLDDRPGNLREATRVQNAQNQAPRCGKVSGLPQGVSTQNGRFQARITISGVTTLVGTFDAPEAAHSAYLAARKEHFGEYA